MTLIFVPSHAGIKLNERTDSLESRVTMVDDRAMDHTKILNAFKDTGQKRLQTMSWFLHC